MVLSGSTGHWSGVDEASAQRLALVGGGKFLGCRGQHEGGAERVVALRIDAEDQRTAGRGLSGADCLERQDDTLLSVANSATGLLTWRSVPLA